MTVDEHLEGWPVDLACLRRHPASEYVRRAQQHMTACALMGHCLESGYGLVQDDNTVVPLDTEATIKVVDALRGRGSEQGVRVRIRREVRDGEMVTRTVERVVAAG